MLRCLSSTSHGRPPGESPWHSCNVQTLVLHELSVRRTPFPSAPSVPEGKGQRQADLSWHIPCLGSSSATKVRHQKTTTETKQTPKSISVPAKDTRCEPQRRLLRSPHGRGGWQCCPPAAPLLTAPGAGRAGSGAQRQQRAFRGISAPPDRAGQSPGAAAVRDGTVPISGCSQRCCEGKAQVSEKWPGLGRALPGAAGPAQPSAACPGRQHRSQAAAGARWAALRPPARHRDPSQPRLGHGAGLTCSPTGQRTPSWQQNHS